MHDQAFRDLMAGVCAQVTVVTTADEEGCYGATVSSFTSLSLSPPLVTMALDRRASLLPRITGSGRFGVNVLAAAGDDLAKVFAARGADRFATVPWHLSQGLPRLKGTAGWAACEVERVVEGGDHLLFIGLVTHAESTPLSPLVYGYRTFGTHSGFAERKRRPVVDHILACSS